MNPFVEGYQDKIAGVISCFDRIVITGTLPDIGYAGAMAQYLSYHEIRLFDYPHWAERLRDELRDHADQLALEAGIEIEFIRHHKAFRKEDRIKAILAQRGDHPGLVHIFSAMEACTAYRPWHDKHKGHTTLKPTSGKCLHYYFYFIDEAFGLCYVRVPTWAPFRLQVYFNLKRAVESLSRWFSTGGPVVTTVSDGYPGAGKRAGGCSCRPWRYFTSA